MKILGKIAASLFGVFVILMIVSVIIFSVTGQIQNVPAQFDSLPGVNVGPININNSEENMSYSDQQAHDLSAIKHVSVKANATTLNIVQSDVPQLTADFQSAVTISGKQQFRLTSYIEGDTLYLKVEQASPFSLFNFSFSTNNKLDIVIPKAFTGNLSLNANAGSSDVRELNLAGTLDIHSNAGSAALTNIACDSISLDSNAGKVNLQNLTVQNEASLNTNAGNIDGSGLYAGTLRVHTTAGGANIDKITSDLTLTGTAGSFRLGFETITGDIRIDNNAANVTLTIPAGAPVWLEDNTGVSGHLNDNVNWTGNGKHMQNAKYGISVGGSASTYTINEQ